MRIEVDAGEAWRVLAEVDAALESATGRVGKRGSAVIRRSALAIEAGAKARAPVDTGFLKGSITTSVSGDGRFGAMEAEIGPEASYAAFLELGTRKMSPRPYLRPAFDAEEPRFVAAAAALADLNLGGMRGGAGV